jgi:hypothetical protein
VFSTRNPRKRMTGMTCGTRVLGYFTDKPSDLLTLKFKRSTNPT